MSDLNTGIPMKDLIDRRYYKFRGRNFNYGVWCAEKKGFFGLRDKFGLRLEHEFHNECGPPFGTVFGPMEDLGIDLPEDISNVEFLGTMNTRTKRWIVLDESIPNPNESQKGKMGWWVDAETEEPQGPTSECWTTAMSNDAMFNWLIEQERALSSGHFVKQECQGCHQEVTHYDKCDCVVNFDSKQRCYRCWRPRDGWECEFCDAKMIARRRDAIPKRIETEDTKPGKVIK